MFRKQFYIGIRHGVAIVWLINGLYCKLLNFVPRHQSIVRHILGANHAVLFTRLIAIAEIGMFLWIISNLKVRLNATVQIVIIGTMNLLEFFLVPDLLLWGRGNAVFALLLMLLIAYNEFILLPKIRKNGDVALS